VIEKDHQFRELEISLPQLETTAAEELARLGYTALEGLVPPDQLVELRTAFDERIAAEGPLPEIEFQKEPGSLRLSNCVNKGDVFLRAAFLPLVLAAAAHVIGRPFKLHGYNARDPLLGGGGQALHRDVDTGPQLEGRQSNGSRDLINAMWVLDDFTISNGPTRVVPGSHLHDRDIDDEMDDPTRPHPAEMLLTASAGTIIIVNGALWHSGTVNTSGESRRSFHISFVERHFPQQVEQRSSIDRETYLALSPIERYILDV